MKIGKMNLNAGEIVWCIAKPREFGNPIVTPEYAGKGKYSPVKCFVRYTKKDKMKRAFVCVSNLHGFSKIFYEKDIGKWIFRSEGSAFMETNKLNGYI